MAGSRGGLLARIEADVVDNSVPLSSLLQMCIVLGGQAGSEKMRDWARQELNGYARADEVPDYRRVPAALMAFITNSAGYNGRPQRFSVSVFPRELQDMFRSDNVDLEVAIFNQGVGELESMASQSTEAHDIIPPWSNVIADTLNQHNMAPNSRVAEVYWSVSNASIRGILVRVRTALADLVAELITLTPQDQDVPDKLAADQAVQIVVNGGRPTIHNHAGDIVTHSSDEYNFGDITGNVAAGSSNVAQNYNAGFDITKVREFADLAVEIAGLIGLDVGQQDELTAATAQLHEAINDPAADKGRMRRAVDSVMGYLKLAAGTALTKAAITAGDQAGNEIDIALRHIGL